MDAILVCGTQNGAQLEILCSSGSSFDNSVLRNSLEKMSVNTDEDILMTRNSLE
jgi:hypothetical protein